MKAIFYSIFFLTLFSCGKSQLTPEEYVAWSDDSENNLVKVFNQNTLQLTCQFTTPEYVSLKQSDPANIDTALLRENIEALNGMVHFKLKFEDTTTNNFLKPPGTTGEEFNTKTMYLSYDIAPDLKLVQCGDTLPCIMNHHERTYGSTPYETLLISFSSASAEVCDLEVIFNDRVFGLGRVKFFFSKEDLENIPELNY
jgi:hypothetical protein